MTASARCVTIRIYNLHDGRADFSPWINKGRVNVMFIPQFKAKEHIEEI